MSKLHDDALRIWQAGVDAVRSDRLVRETLRVEGTDLLIGDESLPMAEIGRIAVIGAGKAGAGMAAGVEQALGPKWLDAKQVTGWVNVPDDCVSNSLALRERAGVRGRTAEGQLEETPRRIHLHPARPAGVNEPMPAGAAGAAEILRIVESLGPDDLCLALISGGGSALMPAPVEGIRLEDKLAVTRFLSAAGANIEELNTVRKQLSRIKGGGLLRACRAGRLVALIISDVLGDPLDVIASGPTVEDSSTPAAALAVLDKFDARAAGIAPAIFAYLTRKKETPIGVAQLLRPPYSGCQVTNLIIGNNATAVDAAGQEAVRLGYSPALVSARQSEGPAEAVGRHLAAMALQMRSEPGPDCLISGGEPVVKLAPAERRGLGGRNQQLVLAAVEQLAADGAASIALLSGGTDGEDGPTDAAGAIADHASFMAAAQRGLDPADYLARNDAYHFFEPLGALIKTGPTHTNVCDLRVVVVERS
jgi:hydroxypyruvate reductase